MFIKRSASQREIERERAGEENKDDNDNDDSSDQENRTPHGNRSLLLPSARNAVENTLNSSGFVLQGVVAGLGEGSLTDLKIAWWWLQSTCFSREAW